MFIALRAFLVPNSFDYTPVFTLEKRTLIFLNVLNHVIQVEYLDSMFQKNMESVLLSIKEEIADETKYGSSFLHHDIGVLAKDSNKVMGCKLDKFLDSSFLL